MSRRVFYHHKADAIKKPVVALLKAAKVPYWDVNGTFDLVVGIPRDRSICIVELKSDTKSPLKPSQVDFLRQWEGFNVVVVRSIDEMARLLGVGT